MLIYLAAFRTKHSQKGGFMKVADMHCDTIAEILYAKKSGKNKSICLRKNGLHIDLDKMKKGDYLLQNFAMFVDLQKRENPFEWCMELADTFYGEMEENSAFIAPVRTYGDIEKNIKDKKISALLTIEEGGVCKENLAFLRDFYRLGVRMLTLTWNYKNGLGHPNKRKEFPLEPDTVNGLTPLGIEFLQEMERLGIIVDVSHLSDAGFYDVVKYAKKPFVASHSNARSVCGNVRNLTDDMLKKIADCGGVTGINFEPLFLYGKTSGEKFCAGIAQVVSHIKHIAKVAGTECIGLGSDFDGITTNEELMDASYLPRLEDALFAAGFSQNQVEGIFYKNVLRVYRELL